MKITIFIDGKVHERDLIQDQSILENLKDFHIPYSCKKGHCGICICQIKSGEVEMKNSLALTDKEIESGSIVTCQAFAKSNIEIII